MSEFGIPDHDSNEAEPQAEDVSDGAQVGEFGPSPRPEPPDAHPYRPISELGAIPDYLIPPRAGKAGSSAAVGKPDIRQFWQTESSAPPPVRNRTNTGYRPVPSPDSPSMKVPHTGPPEIPPVAAQPPLEPMPGAQSPPLSVGSTGSGQADGVTSGQRFSLIVAAAIVLVALALLLLM